ncbi:DUF3027 domain-containing protein [Bifidobacterium felsineum]|uniref:DUF3027 domain-containing protein n=1 Tax=Bifidobacterium felsineum TaxID=2045440 RepID=A0A2M9HMP7_9BIFI|nr:DUF3027 domain-containing protein [Bifidobacterium felsineum]PJM78059.1 hypothetical protein CSQ86_03270 [Bifidobacterium felsineum]
MTDSTETTVTPDPRAIAHAVLLEVADEPEQVGQFVAANELEDHVTDFRFAANIRGYEGWQWSVTLYHDLELDSWTVNESSLIPTEEALLPPKWIPWKDRLEPTDLSPTDSIGTDPDDERLETGEVEESSVPDVNDAAETFRLTRRHVLSPLGRAQAAKRWYEGPRGPKALSTKTAAGNLCSDCGFFVPLTGELDRMFGVCANKWSPDDGRVVSLDHGCGEHSEIEPPEPSHLWVQSKPALDDLHIDVVARPKVRKAEETDEAEPETLSEASTADEEHSETATAENRGDESSEVHDDGGTASPSVSDDAVTSTGDTASDESAERSYADVESSAITTGADSGTSANEPEDIVEVSAATGANGADAVDATDVNGDEGLVAESDVLDDESDDADAVFDDGDDDDDSDDDEATEEDIINNTSVDFDDDDDLDADDEMPETTEEVAPELETVIDLIEQLRQSKAEEESNTDIDAKGNDDESDGETDRIIDESADDAQSESKDTF